MSDLRASESDAWRHLIAIGGRESLFVTPEWLGAWVTELGGGWTPLLLAVSDRDEIAAIAPFGLRPGSLTAPATVSLLGTGCTDYLGPLVDPRAGASAIEALLSTLVADWSNWQLLDLPGLPAESPAVSWLAQAARGLGLLCAVLPGYACPELPIAGSWSSHLAARGTGFRSWLGRRRRQLERLGGVRFVHLRTPREALSALDAVIALHGRRWRGQHTSSVFSSSASGRRFYRSVTAAYAERGQTDLVLLERMGEPIAAALSFEHAGRYAYYMPVHDPAYDAFSPGTVLLAHLVEQAHERRFTIFDFMVGEESYKYRWATTEQHTVRFIAARRGSLGALAFGVARARVQLRLKARQLALARAAYRRFGGMFR